MILKKSGYIRYINAIYTNLRKIELKLFYTRFDLFSNKKILKKTESKLFYIRFNLFFHKRYSIY